MSDMKRLFENLEKKVRQAAVSAVDTLDANTRGWSETVKKERRKMELRSQIGKHQRMIQKAYARLGELYYMNHSKGVSMDQAADILNILDSNIKVVDLLKQQLEELEKADRK